MGERGLHAHAEDIELEQAEGLDVVLVEGAHGIALAARLDGGAVEQGGVGEQHAAGVHGDVAGQAVEALDELPEVVELTARGHAAEPGVAQLGQVAQGTARIAGAHVGEGLGEGVDLTGGQGERGADIADGVAHAVGLHHRDGGNSLGAEALDDGVVDLEPARGLDVDVDVGELATQRGEEALHEQAVAHRVDAGDAEQVVDQAACARAARGDADAARAGEVDDLGDGEEVGGEAEGGDGAQLFLESVARGDALGAAVAIEARLAAGAQDRVSARSISLADDDVELGHDDLADAEIGRGEGALPRQLDRGSEEILRGTPAGARGPCDLLGDVGHEGCGGEEALGIGAVTVALVEGDEAARGIEDVDDAPLPGMGVAHGMGEDGSDAAVAGPAEGARGDRGGERAAARTMAHDLDAQGLAEDLAPRRDELIGEIGSTDGERLDDR